MKEITIPIPRPIPQPNPRRSIGRIFLLGILAASLIGGGITPSAPAAEAPASGLFERAIYEEETKGDLAKAIQLYQEILNEAQRAQALAAQAQYRLALCFLKQNQPDKAQAALQNLIKNFPNERDLISKAQRQISADFQLLPIPWQDGELLEIHLKLQTGLVIGAIAYTADLVPHEGQTVWRVGARTFSGVQALSQVKVVPESFQPLHSRWIHGLLGDMEAFYGEKTVQLKPHGAGSPSSLDISGPVYDNEEVIHLLRRLPLALGYRTSLSIISSFNGPQIIPLGLEVTSIDTLQVPAGSFECYKVDLDLKQTFWISTGPERYLVKMLAGGATGELVRALHRQSPSQDAWDAPGFGLSVNAPRGWFLFRDSSRNDPGKTRAMALDLASTAHINIAARTLATLKSNEKLDLKTWAETDLREESTRLKDFKLQPPGLRSLVFTGQPGLTFVADYLDNDKKKTVSGAFIQGSQSRASLLLFSTPETFPRDQASFDELLRGLKMQ